MVSKNTSFLITHNSCTKLKCYGFRYQNSKSEPCSVDVNQVPLCSLADVQLRFLCPGDLDEVRALCQDWFPIEYPLTW